MIGREQEEERSMWVFEKVRDYAMDSEWIEIRGCGLMRVRLLDTQVSCPTTYHITWPHLIMSDWIARISSYTTTRKPKAKLH
jgi:hypothetical protein